MGLTGSWSMAHGIKQGTSVLSPKIWGNEFENDGAAWMEGKWLFPMLSLQRTMPHGDSQSPSVRGACNRQSVATHESLKPKVALDWLYVSILEILTMFQ